MSTQPDPLVRPRRKTIGGTPPNSSPSVRRETILKQREQKIKAQWDQERLHLLNLRRNKAKLLAEQRARIRLQQAADAIKDLAQYLETSPRGTEEIGEEFDQVVIFNLHSPTDLSDYGDRVYVVGACPELGMWELERIERMFDEEPGMRWVLDVRISVKKNRVIEYKYVIQSDDGRTRHEQIENRRLMIFNGSDFAEEQPLVINDEWEILTDMSESEAQRLYEERELAKSLYAKDLAKTVNHFRSSFKNGSKQKNDTFHNVTINVVKPKSRHSPSHSPSKNHLYKGRTLASSTPYGSLLLMETSVKSRRADDRVVNSVAAPEWNRLSSTILFNFGEKNPNFKLLRQHLQKEGRLEIEAAAKILKEVKEIMSQEPNLLRLETPIAVFGDIHGQFYDLLNIMDQLKLKIGPPSDHTYLFLGDYVDRGCFSTEVCFYLFALKLMQPQKVFLLRGNHESRLLTSHFNFKSECLHKYNCSIYDLFMEVFDSMPLAALLISKENGNSLAMHGGLSPSIHTLSEIEKVNRFQEPSERGPMSDFVWSDPTDEEVCQDHDLEEFKGWFENDFSSNGTRGCGYVFGYKAVTRFLQENELMCIIRGHEVQSAGYLEHYYALPKDEIKMPLVVTVFSAPNYCDLYGNKASVLILDKPGNLNYEIFDWVDHPFYLPNFTNAIQYTFPFVIENLAKLWLPVSQIQLDEEEDGLDQTLNKMIKTSMDVATEFRKQNETEIKHVSLLVSDHSQAGPEQFEAAALVDNKNEKRPKLSSRKVYKTWSGFRSMPIQL